MFKDMQTEINTCAKIQLIPELPPSCDGCEKRRICTIRDPAELAAILVVDTIQSLIEFFFCRCKRQKKKN